jgi:trimeric autotransporter adhesin
MATPCNTLNVEYIKISTLNDYNSFKDNDLIYIIQSGSGNLKYSRQSNLADFKTYMSTGSFSGIFSGDVTGTSSYSISSSHALFADQSESSSFSLNSTSASYSNKSTTSDSSTSASYSNTSTTSDSSTSASYSNTSTISDSSISASYSETSSYTETVETSSYSFSSSYANKASFSNSIAPGFPYITTDTLDNILTPASSQNAVYRYDHGLGTVPSLVQVKLYVSSTWTTHTSFVQGDELDTNVLMVGNSTFDNTPIWVKYDASSIYITYTGYIVASITSASRMRILPNSLPSNNSSAAFLYPGWIEGAQIEWNKLKYKIYVWK